MEYEKPASFGEPPLKSAALKRIEETIAKAIGKLVGQEYAASIINLDFEPCLNAWLSDTVEIKLRLSRPMKGSLLGETEK